MKCKKVLVPIVQILLLLVFASQAFAWQPALSPMAPMTPQAGMMGSACPPMVGGPACPPPIMGPCFPQTDCKWNYELGARAFYSTNYFKIVFDDGRANIDFVRDLNFARNLVIGEFYGALRLSPNFALTYTGSIPRPDSGYGIIPSRLNMGGAIIPAGSSTYWQINPFNIRQDIEYYLVQGCNYRLGALLTTELWVSEIKVRYRGPNDIADSETKDTRLVGWPGFGGVVEYAPFNQLFLRVKGTYNITPGLVNGFKIAAEGKVFPDMNSGTCGGPAPSIRPYITAGYLFDYAWIKSSDDEKIEAYVNGPYGELGFIF